MDPRPPTSSAAPNAAADPTWFRPPTRREHVLGFALFTGFGLFFLLLFVVQRRWWFSWVTLALTVTSIYRGLKHARLAIVRRPSDQQGGGADA